MPLWRSFIGYAVRRAASDPALRAKAQDYLTREVKPRVSAAAQAARSDWRELSDEIDPRDAPARFAGRFIGRWRGRLKGGDES